MKPTELDGTEPNFDYAVIARIKPGITLEQMRAEFDGILTGSDRRTPSCWRYIPCSPAWQHAEHRSLADRYGCYSGPWVWCC